jgi:methionyl-tRNA synthetase
MLNLLLNNPAELSLAVVLLIWLLIIWSLIWKGIALWKCGRNAQLPWFVAILILNTAGILPIVYLLFFQKKGKKK